MNTFLPKRNLALCAVIHEARQALRLPLKPKLFVIGVTSGLLLTVNVFRYFMHESVTIFQWIGSVFAAPLFLLIVLIGQYALYRFASPVSVSADGLRFGSWGRVLAFWKPVDCKVTKFDSTTSLFSLSILCISPLNSKPHSMYSGLTDDFDSTQEFIAAFKQKYSS